MQMAEANAAQIFSEQAKKEQSWETLATTLQGKLRLTNRPDTIECLDISNLQGKQAVGSLVCFCPRRESGESFPPLPDQIAGYPRRLRHDARGPGTAYGQGG